MDLKTKEALRRSSKICKNTNHLVFYIFLKFNLVNIKNRCIFAGKFYVFIIDNT